MTRASALFAVISLLAVFSGAGLWLALGISCVTLVLLRLNRITE